MLKQLLKKCKKFQFQYILFLLYYSINLHDIYFLKTFFES